MSVKFRLGFTVDAQTMFSLMAKLLPIEDLHVEELIEAPHAPAPRIAKPQAQVRKPDTRARRGEPPTGGQRFAILQPAFAKGPLTFKEMQDLLSQAGFAGTGLGSAVSAWTRYGFIERSGPGRYRLKAKAEAP
jgi:hypothetical protein